jgi:hypothetical protein
VLVVLGVPSTPVFTRCRQLQFLPIVPVFLKLMMVSSRLKNNVSCDSSLKITLRGDFFTRMVRGDFF